MRALAHYLLGALLVTASAYTACPSEGGPLAADGTCVVPGRTVAVSRDQRHLLGKYIHIDGIGRRLVNDLMAARWRQAIDVAVPSKRAANEFGRQTVAVRVER